MTKNQLNQLLESLANNKYGEALTQWLEENIDELKDVTTIKGGEADMIGRQEAVKTLRKMFRFLKNKQIRVEIKKPNSYV